MVPSLRKLQEERQQHAQQQQQHIDRQSETNKTKAVAVAEASYAAFCGKHQGPGAKQSFSEYVHNSANELILKQWILGKHADITLDTLERSFAANKHRLSSEPDAEGAVPAEATPEPEPTEEIPFSASELKAMSRIEWNSACKQYGWKRLNEVIEQGQ